MANKFFDIKMWLYDFIKWTGALPAAIDLRPKKLYETSKEASDLRGGSYIISCNHSTFIDPIIVTACFWFRRIYFIATKDFWKSKFWGFFFTRVNCIPIDKESTDIKTFLTVKEKINVEKRPVCIFPEGSVHEDALGKFKSGVVMMANIANAEILPIYIGKRKKIFINKQRIVIGDRIKIGDYTRGKIPTMEEIENLTNILIEKEKKLEKIFLEDTK